MKTACFVPAKSSSTRLPNKNCQLLAGTPLFLYTLEKLIKSKVFDEVFLDTDSDFMMDAARKIGCRIMMRDKQYASNATDGNQLLLNEIEQHPQFDIYAQVLCTSPFISTATLEHGLNAVIQGGFDSAVLTRTESLYLWQADRPTYNPDLIPNSSSLDPTTYETMGYYVIRKDVALETKRRIGAHPYLIQAKPIETIDIDYPEDLDLANIIALGVKNREIALRRLLAAHLTSSSLSDVLVKMGIPFGVLSGFKSNTGRKFYGPAKTMKLRKAINHDPGSIYDALNSYSTVTLGDVIVVETELPDLAYFGDLNARLAIRSGAIAAIIGGKTRDGDQVANKLDFTVLAKGFTPFDIKNSGRVASINETVSIDGTQIGCGDLLFSDSDGCIVIPRRCETAVVEECLNLLNTEKSIVRSILDGTDVAVIQKTFGDF